MGGWMGSLSFSIWWNLQVLRQSLITVLGFCVGLPLHHPLSPSATDLVHVSLGGPLFAKALLLHRLGVVDFLRLVQGLGGGLDVLHCLQCRCNLFFCLPGHTQVNEQMLLDQLWCLKGCLHWERIVFKQHIFLKLPRIESVFVLLKRARLGRRRRKRRGNIVLLLTISHLVCSIGYQKTQAEFQ